MHELQQQLEQERAVSLRKEKEEEERKGVRTDMNRILMPNTPSRCISIVHSSFCLKCFLCVYKLSKMTVLF